jgi:preprotein translocase subunit SecG
MTVLLLLVHIVVCLFLIAIVLLQSGKGAELGATFGGGSSHTLFGGRGAATFLSKMTTVAAVVFMITSLVLAVVTAKGGSVMKRSTVTQGNKTLPSMPAGPVQSEGVQPSKQTQQQKQVPQIPSKSSTQPLRK